MLGTGAHRIVDAGVTLLCWLYFTLGFVLFFFPLYAGSWLCLSQPENVFQRLNCFFYRGFFALLRITTPRVHWQLDERIAAIRSAVLVCNHRSYLDPILLISLLDRARTIVKPFFFTLPVFGWVIRTAGYIPASAHGTSAQLMLARMEDMPAYLAQGGTLFVFPEGTRIRQGEAAKLQQGALKIARQCQVPVYVVCLENTERIFAPGKFLFTTTQPALVKVQLIEHFDPPASLKELAAGVEQALGRCGQSMATMSEEHVPVNTKTDGA